MINLKEKVILVMGGTSGIGSESVRKMSELGSTVIFTGRREELGFDLEKELNSKGRDVKFLKCDASIEKEVVDVMEYIEKNHKKLDGAINTQVHSDKKFTPAHEMDLDYWNESMSINITSYFISMKHQLNLMLKSGGGSIVNISSVAGLKASKMMPLVDYVTSKHAIIGMTKDVASSYGAFNIRANCLCPGFTKTEANKFIWDNPEAEKNIASQNPITRWGTTEEMAGVLSFLMSEESSFITGQSLFVDGGFSIV